jgi:hypothetical protein
MKLIIDKRLVLPFNYASNMMCLFLRTSETFDGDILRKLHNNQLVIYGRIM